MNPIALVAASITQTGLTLRVIDRKPIPRKSAIKYIEVLPGFVWVTPRCCGLLA